MGAQRGTPQPYAVLLPAQVAGRRTPKTPNIAAPAAMAAAAPTTHSASHLVDTARIRSLS
jgi:hypothetical protein